MTKKRLTAAMLAVSGAALCACSTSSAPHMMPHFQWPGSRAQVEKAPNPCIDFDTSVYFAANVSSLSRDNRMALDTAADQARGCKIGGIIVTGLSDPSGTSAANMALSQKRADAVRQALAAHGFSDVTFSVDAAGALGAANADGSVDPLRRRADVQFKLSPLPPAGS